MTAVADVIFAQPVIPGIAATPLQAVSPNPRGTFKQKPTYNE